MVMNKNEIVIRPMGGYDIPQILAIEEKSFRHPWNRNKFLEELVIKKSCSFVAVPGPGAEEILGYIIGRHAAEELNIMDLAVAPQRRKQGIGRKLLDHIREFARKNGVKSLFLEVRSKNLDAIKLYRTYGFRTYATRKKYYIDDDALLMQAEII